ncbi:siderophore-interacting protein [Streptomyces sp. V4-01]|uniref:Siderophore-interacting protein n=1 Tax=Actinacidiphila polyblastidii TaxID=3110430 RepID=A0ABU7PLU0_9ACTN|nr:siderophore-interacting protein [Streptomyces sp. V4-01]
MSTATTTSEPAPSPEAAAAPYAFFHPRVVRTLRLSPTLLRVVLGGEELGAVVSGGRDQRFKLFLPQPGQRAPVLPDVLDSAWYPRWRALDPEVRGIMRTYTIRDARPAAAGRTAEVDVDFALHGDIGPASRWAGRAAPGDLVSILAPVVRDNGGVDFRLPDDARWVLLTADETALPAVAGILASLPAGLPVRAWIEVAHPDDRVPLPTAAAADVTWVVRGRSDLPLAEAVAARPLPGPPAAGYAWLAGEASSVRALRRSLVGGHGLDRRRVAFTGYWRRGTTEDDLLAEGVAAAGED